MIWTLTALVIGTVAWGAQSMIAGVRRLLALPLFAAAFLVLASMPHGRHNHESRLDNALGCLLLCGIALYLLLKPMQGRKSVPAPASSSLSRPMRSASAGRIIGFLSFACSAISLLAVVTRHSSRVLHSAIEGNGPTAELLLAIGFAVVGAICLARAAAADRRARQEPEPPRAIVR